MISKAWYEIIKYNKRDDYLSQDIQVKTKLKVMSIGISLRPKPFI